MSLSRKVNTINTCYIKNERRGIVRKFNLFLFSKDQSSTLSIQCLKMKRNLVIGVNKTGYLFSWERTVADI